MGVFQDKRVCKICPQLFLTNKNRKGSGQLEMVISFVFFVGFIFVLFLFLAPGDTTSLSDAVIEGLQGSFRERVYTNMSSFFLSANHPTPIPCFSVHLSKEIFEYSIEDEETYVAVLSGNKVESNIIVTGLSINSLERYYRVAISPEFDDEGISSCTNIGDFELGNILERKVVSYKALESMRDDYYDNYDSLRNSLKVPPVYDFAIVFENMPELNMILERGESLADEVLTKDYVFEVLKSSGNLTNERINFRIW